MVKAFDSVPLDVLFTVLAKSGGVSVIKRMNTDLQVIFDLNGEPVAVPWSTFCAASLFFVLKPFIFLLRGKFELYLLLGADHSTQKKTSGPRGHPRRVAPRS